MKKMLSKEEFVEYINKVKDVNDRWSKFYDIIDAWPGGEDKLSLISEVTQLLSLIMQDEIDPRCGTNIDWFCWDTDFGSRDEVNKIWIPKDSETVEIVIDTPEKLYDFLIENIDEREEDN